MAVSVAHRAGYVAPQRFASHLDHHHFRASELAGLGWPGQSDSGRSAISAAGRLHPPGPGFRLPWVHVLPNLRPVLRAQFWISVPVFILGEATLGLLGLGVTEPLPSWGNMLRGLESYSSSVSGPWALSPILLLFVVMSCLHLIFPGRDFST
jgi:hypothetical protein